MEQIRLCTREEHLKSEINHVQKSDRLRKENRSLFNMIEHVCAIQLKEKIPPTNLVEECGTKLDI